MRVLTSTRPNVDKQIRRGGDLLVHSAEPTTKLGHDFQSEVDATNCLLENVCSLQGGPKIAFLQTV